MKKLQVLGTGCPKCKLLFANAETAVKALGAGVEVVKVEKITEILNFGVMMTPALAVDGQVVAAGKVLSVDDIKSVLRRENP